jgi:hypothetical protein
MIPLTAAELDPPLSGAVELGAVEPCAVDVSLDPVLVFEPLELPQAASRATPPAPAPSRSCRRGQLKVEGVAAELSDKTTSEWAGAVRRMS